MENYVTKIPSELFWNIHDTLTYPERFKHIYSARSNGKTYGWKYFAIKDFIKTDGVHMFTYFRRNRTNLKRVGEFYNDLEDIDILQGIKVNKDGSVFYKGRLAGFLTSMTDIMQKSQVYQMANGVGVYNICFDEFICEGGYQRYLKDEFNIFGSCISTIARYRDFRCYLLANNVSHYNPYFLELGYSNSEKGLIWKNKKPENGYQANSLVQNVYSEELTDLMSKTPFGQCFSGTSYGDFAINNDSLTDTNDGLKCKTGTCQCIAILIVDSKLYGVWRDYRTSDCYISKSIGDGSAERYCVDKGITDKNIYTFHALKLSNKYAFIVNSYDYGTLYCEDMQCKNAIFKVLKAGFAV